MVTRSLQSRFNISNRQAVELVTEAACLVQVFAKIAQLRGWRQAASFLAKQGKTFGGRPPHCVLLDAPISDESRVDVLWTWLNIKHNTELPNFAKAKVEVLNNQHLE